MAKNVEMARDKVMYDFIVGKCQLIPKCYDAVSEPIYFEDEYAILCGSTMEFYIRPLNSGINDMDALIVKRGILTFQSEFPGLPIDVSRLRDIIECYRMEPYLRYPGFVRLRFWGKLNYSWKYKTFEFDQTTDIVYIKISTFENVVRHQMHENFSAHSYIERGPAITIHNSAVFAPNDSVFGLWCPTWPTEAQGWPKRHRDHGWPTIDTISEVVEHGCHVVHVQHRDCRNDILQCRLSFSVAEVILLQSWTKLQQIVYHMLRFFSGKELINKNCPKEDEVLCTYHLKTLMLWTCEEKSPEWWNRSSIIAICCALLEALSEWLKRGYCPNYFIPEANLFHEPFISPMFDDIERKLTKFGRSDILWHWFFGNYIIPIIVARSNFKLQQKVDISKCLQTLTDDRETLQSKSLDLLFLDEFMYCNLYTRKSINSKIRVIHPRSVLNQLSLLRKFKMLGDPRMSIFPMPVDVSSFTYFDKTVFCLNTAYSLAYGEMSSNSDLFEYVRVIFSKKKILRCKYHIFPEPSTADKSQCQLLRAQHLMENITGSNSPPEFQLLSVISKAFLRKALECDDNHSNIIAPAALTYLAALHFAESEYEIVINVCSAILANQTTHIESETVNAGCLLFIDDISRIVGFSLLCRKLNENTRFIGRQIYLDLRLSVKVFAYYLTVASAGRISKQFELNNGQPTSTFPFDLYVLTFVKDTCKTSFNSLKFSSDCLDFVTTNASLDVDRSIRTDNVIDSLTEIAMENLTLFYNRIGRDFNIQCNTIDCYRALYLYKCRRYDEVLHLCERILREPDLQSDLKESAFANVLVMTTFDSFFDIDVQSLLGLQTLTYYTSPLTDDLYKFKLATQYFRQGAHFNSLLKHYSVTSDCFLGRHFLARYLILRCHFDCKHPYKTELHEFYSMKISLPFEHIIRRFLQQRLCRIHQ